MPSQRVSSILFILLAAYILFESRKYPLGKIDNPGPGFLPLLLGLAIGGMSILLLIRGWKKKTEAGSPAWPDRAGWFRVILIFSVTLLFTLFFEITGYIVNIFVLFLVLLRPVGKQKWSWTICISVGATVVSYLLFDRWLMLPLPRGVWFSY
jgi:putative tricarboxylic transport membrane protein